MAWRAILISALVAGTLAGPLSFWGDEQEILAPSSNTCAVSCPESAKFSYIPEKTYQYTYTSQILTTVGGAMDQFSTLNLAATVNLEVLAPCEMALRLSDVVLQDAEPGTASTPGHVDGAWDFKRMLQARPLRFAFLDGKIANICPDPDEEAWVKNVKRGVISAFQNRMPTLETNTRITEEDVSGACAVEYEMTSRGWGSTNIRKTKNLLACTDRQHTESAFQGTPYRVSSKLQSLPILKGIHECNQAINSDGILKSSICHESHIFRPFSKYDSGALTNVTSTLTFSRIQPGVRTSLDDRVLKRESLKFEHNHDEFTQEDESRIRPLAQRTLRQLCRTATDDIRPETPAMFADLVREMRKLNADNLNSLYQAAEGERLCDKAQKFFRDAVPMLGTSASVALIRDLITGDDVSATEADIWLTSLAFISRPTIEMLREAKPMLQMEPRRPKVALSISAIVNTYCKENPQCTEEREVRDIIAVFEEDLRYNCMIANDEQYTRVMMALKGLGNAGHADQAIAALTRCYINDEAPMAIRVAAVNAFRRMPCEADQSELANILRDDTKESELRISAYLAMMACPDMAIITTIEQVLNTENVNQVGSFIWTHLTNLQETSHVFKREIRAIVENEELEREFDMDKRKFSRNIEWSAFSEWMNTGAMVESNLIWSTKSYIPRSAMVNVTVDMFGDSFNLMEIGGRLEGFENLLERLFGPSSNEVERERRSASNEIRNLDNEYNIASEAEPEGSYYMRFFGNEINYGSFRGLDFSSLQERFNYLQWLIDLSKEHHYDVTKSFMFLESTLIVPTIAGFPLKLSVEGSSVMEAKINGHLDLRQMATAPRSINIEGTIKPSAAIEISGTMGIDAKMARTGVKMTNTLHTSTVTTATVQLRDGQVFSMDINTPTEKMEVFTAQSKFFLIYRDEEREQPMLEADQRTHQKCVGGELLEKVTGMQLCGEVSYPAVFSRAGVPWPPMTGPASAKIELYKRDTMTGYHFEAKKKKVPTATLR